MQPYTPSLSFPWCLDKLVHSQQWKVIKHYQREDVTLKALSLILSVNNLNCQPKLYTGMPKFRDKQTAHNTHQQHLHIY